MEPAHDTPGALLALHMRRRGWSAARLAGIAGRVSASSIRAYAADHSIPRPTQALAVAGALGPREGRGMLEAWGYQDLAEGFVGRWREAMVNSDEKMTAVADEYYRYNKVEYSGEPLSEAGIAVIQAVAQWAQHLEQVAASRPPTSQLPAEG